MRMRSRDEETFLLFQTIHIFLNDHVRVRMICNHFYQSSYQFLPFPSAVIIELET